MSILKNSRHELFVQAIVKGMSQTDAAIEAGYKKSRAKQTGHRLVTYGYIIKRREELSKLAISDTVMTVKQRKERLTGLANETNRQPVTAKEIVQSIAELNKMDGVYAEGATVNIDNRKVEIIVSSETAKKLTEQIIKGEGT